MTEYNPDRALVLLPLDSIAKQPHIEKLNIIEEKTMKMEFYTLMFAMMFFFFVIAACNSKFKPKYGHQTSFTLIIGVVVAIFLW